LQTLAELGRGRVILALVALVASGQIPLDAVELQSYAFADLEAAIDAAGQMAGLQCTVVGSPEEPAWG
jgi:alcohol dehydrogenase